MLPDDWPTGAGPQSKPSVAGRQDVDAGLQDVDGGAAP
jgi:hypothetical protein